MHPSAVTREMLRDFLHDALPEAELAAVERAVRASAELRALLDEVREQEDRGEHTVGAIWRRPSCVARMMSDNSALTWALRR